MRHWEIDFGQLATQFEFFAVVDRGTSILVNTQVQTHYNAETALLALATLFVIQGLPTALRFDRDSRFVSSWAMDGYPAPLVRFLWCLGVRPDPTPPRRPDLKPFVERCIRTLKHECLWVHRPETPIQAADILESYRLFYNAERMNQSSVCGDKPPYVAFPNLPVLPSIADEIDPDVWLEAHHGLVFKRRLDNKGCTTVDCHSYYVGSAYAGELARFHLDARQRCFHVVVKGNTVRQLEVKGLIGEKLSFSAYLKRMLEEARSIDRHRQAAQRNTAATG
jgi:hypothetical protein